MVEFFGMLLAFHGSDQFPVEHGLPGKNDFDGSNKKVIPHIWIVFRFVHGCFPFLCGLSLYHVNKVELYVVSSSKSNRTSVQCDVDCDVFSISPFICFLLSCVAKLPCEVISLGAFGQLNVKVCEHFSRDMHVFWDEDVSKSS